MKSLSFVLRYIVNDVVSYLEFTNFAPLFMRLLHFVLEFTCDNIIFWPQSQPTHRWHRLSNECRMQRKNSYCVMSRLIQTNVETLESNLRYASCVRSFLLENFLHLWTSCAHFRWRRAATHNDAGATEHIRRTYLLCTLVICNVLTASYTLPVLSRNREGWSDSVWTELGGETHECIQIWQHQILTSISLFGYKQTSIGLHGVSFFYRKHYETLYTIQDLLISTTSDSPLHNKVLPQYRNARCTVRYMPGSKCLKSVLLTHGLDLFYLIPCARPVCLRIAIAYK